MWFIAHSWVISRSKWILDFCYRLAIKLRMLRINIACCDRISHTNLLLKIPRHTTAIRMKSESSMQKTCRIDFCAQYGDAGLIWFFFFFYFLKTKTFCANGCVNRIIIINKSYLISVNKILWTGFVRCLFRPSINWSHCVCVCRDCLQLIYEHSENINYYFFICVDTTNLAANLICLMESYKFVTNY